MKSTTYVEPVPDPSDRRAKEADWTKRLGSAKMRQLRELLDELNAGL
jgi:hypothetical protein